MEFSKHIAPVLEWVPSQLNYLMKPVRSPLASIAFSLLGWPLGIVIGYMIVRFVEGLSSPFAGNIPINLVSVIVAPALMLLGLRWALPQEELVKPSTSM